MKAVKTISFITPAKVDLKGGPQKDWTDRFEDNLGAVLGRYTDASFVKLNPGNSSEISNLPAPVVHYALFHPDWSGEYFHFLEEILKGGGSIIRIDCAARIKEVLPESLGRLEAVDFYRYGEDSSELLQDTDPDYWSVLLDLAASLKIPETSTTVFLALGAPDMSGNRDILKRELTECGFNVVPGNDLVFMRSALKSKVQQLADASGLIIHLLGSEYGISMKDTGKSLAELQIHYISEYIEAIRKDPVHSTKELYRLIWIDPEFRPVDSNQEEFIEQLKRNIENLQRTEIIQTPLELFKTLVVKRLRQADSLKESKSDKIENGNKPVYLIHSPVDLDKASDFTAKLEKSGIGAGMLDYGKKQKDLLKAHKSFLRDCEAAIIYYDRANRFWLRSKLMDLLKAPGLGREGSLDHKYVLAAGEDSLDDYNIPQGISLIREKDADKAPGQIVKNLKQ